MQWRVPSTTVYAHYRNGSWHATGLFGRSQSQLAMQRWIELDAGDRHRASSTFELDRLDAVIEAGRRLRIGDGLLVT